MQIKLQDTSPPKGWLLSKADVSVSEGTMKPRPLLHERVKWISPCGKQLGSGSKSEIENYHDTTNLFLLYP